MKYNDIHKIVSIGENYSGYNESEKNVFHQKSKQYLKELVQILGLKNGEYQIRCNKAGIACLGEVILHTNNLYVQLGGSFCREDFMYRTCKGQKDYTGGTNRYMRYEELYDMNKVASIFSALLP